MNFNAKGLLEVSKDSGGSWEKIEGEVSFRHEMKMGKGKTHPSFAGSMTIPGKPTSAHIWVDMESGALFCKGAKLLEASLRDDFYYHFCFRASEFQGQSLKEPRIWKFVGCVQSFDPLGGRAKLLLDSPLEGGGV